MKTLFSALHHALSCGESVILVTVTASSGSTPQGVGARMLVGRSGRLAGTVGGGIAEYRCMLAAQQQLSLPPFRQTRLRMDLSEDADLGAVCGGWMEFHCLPLTQKDEGTLALCEEIAACFASDSPFWLATPQNGQAPLTLYHPMAPAPSLPPMLLASLNGCKGRFYSSDGWFCERMQGAGVVYIFGGGHVAQALVPVLAPLDFPCVVLENREEFSDPALFPLARKVLRIDFSNILESVDISSEDYVCIMTRGHQDDLLIQRQILRTPAQYIGLIGSSKKIATTFAALERLGFSKEEVLRIVTPIGLPIGGKTPAEISISIAAQLILHRSTGRT